MLHKGGLHRVQVLGRAQPLDGGDAVAFVHNRERQARKHPPAADDDGAGAALAVIAALFGTGKTEMFTQGVEQRGSRVEIEDARLAVHRKGDFRRRRDVKHGSSSSRLRTRSPEDNLPISTRLLPNGFMSGARMPS